jgi:uncharacterized repeat protein (TIGR03806 family)
MTKPLILLLAGSSWLIVMADRAVGEDKPRPGLDQRVAWTTSNFRGRPEPPPPFRAERVFTKLHFERPTVLTNAPGTDRLFVAEQGGKVFSIPNDPDCSSADLLLDVNELVARFNEIAADEDKLNLVAVYGLTFHPQFAKNRLCYVCYVASYRDGSRGQHPDGTRVVSLRVADAEPPRCEKESERLVISWLQGGHNGGCLKFGADGCLYISTGDGGFAFPPDGRDSGQDVSNLLSSILRIDVDHASDERSYTIPEGNPFASLPDTRGEIWAYGLRNPWKMSFDRGTGELWAGDVGWELWELVYRVRAGDNYGWSLVEGRQPVHTQRRRGPTPIVAPTIEIPHTEGASITGGFVYRGTKFPELDGTYIFGDWETRRIWGVNVEGEQLGPRRELVEPTVRIVGFSEDNAGELYLLDYDEGTLHALARSEVQQVQQPFPRKLSESGLFASVAEHQVSDGVLRFSINAQQWSDGAVAERFIAIPGTGSIKLHSKSEEVVGSMFKRQMDFPKDAVLLKTLSLDLASEDLETRTRIETQVLHFDGRDWRAYTYEWNAEQTDADLVEAAGRTRAFTVFDAKAPDGKRTQAWRFASRMECIRCHNPWSEYTLAFNLPQLNRDHDYGDLRASQLATYRHIGLLEGAGDVAAARLHDPFDDQVDLNERTRSYLHANCAHCHRFNGGGASYINLQFDLPLKDTGAIDVRPTQGTFGIRDAKIVAPGDPYRSTLYYRLAKVGPGHMPRLGSATVDPRGLELIHEWIREMPAHHQEIEMIERIAELGELARKADDKGTKETTKLIAEMLSTPARAIMLARALHEQRWPDTVTARVVDAAVESEVAIRDLFEPFMREDQKTKRLGETIMPEQILQLSGSIDRGRELFHTAKTIQCRNCHRILGKGTELGPDLSKIGVKNDRAKLLESLLEPSKNIDPKFVTWLVESRAGKVYTGILLERDDQQVRLKDAKGKEHVLPTSEIEEIFRQRKSLMPDLLLRDMTAEQVADLLAYLVSLK